MDDKKIAALIVLVLFGSNLSGIAGIVGNSSSIEGHEDLQRQLDEIKLADTECRATMSAHINEWNEHIEWGREVRADNSGAIQRHEAQIQELYRLYSGIN